MPEYTHVYTSPWGNTRHLVRLTINTKQKVEGYMIEMKKAKNGRTEERYFEIFDDDSKTAFFDRTKKLLIPYTLTPRQVDRATTNTYNGIEPTHTAVYVRQEGAGFVGWNEVPATTFTNDRYFTYNARTGRTHTAGYIDQTEWHRMALDRVTNDAFEAFNETQEAVDRREIERQRIADVTRRANDRARLRTMYQTQNGGRWR